MGVAVPLLAAPRSTPRDSLRWMRWDLPGRILPFLAVPLLLAAWTPLSLRGLGVTLEDAPWQVGLGLLLGGPVGWLSWRWRRRFGRGMVVPSDADALFQSVYYVLLNTPAEELLFRGALLGWLSQRTGSWAAWALSTLVFGLYHLPAGWGPRAVAGVTLAGGLFGALFLAGPGVGSLLLPLVVHAFATCGFLSAGPWCARALVARRERVAGRGIKRGIAR